MSYSPAQSPRYGLRSSGRPHQGDVFGDRFIPNRDSTDLHAAFTMSDKQSRLRTKKRTDNLINDIRKQETDDAFTEILKAEMFPSQSPISSSSRNRSPMKSDNSNIPSYPSSSSLHHLPPPASTSSSSSSHHPSDRNNNALSLPPLPLHGTSTSGAGNDRPPGAGPSGSRYRSHVAQVSLTSGPSNSNNQRSPFSPPPSGNSGGNIYDSPSTPTKKRILNFTSPRSPRINGGLTTTDSLDDMSHPSYSLSPIGKESTRMLLSPKKTIRSISKTPFKVLDAPELADDFYLNLVSWSASNVLGVGLNSCVYLWSAQTSKVTKLCDLVRATSDGQELNDTVTGLEWTNQGSTIAIGTNSGLVEIWDAEYNKRIRTMSGHTGRVGALAWNQHILSTGSRDRNILHRDTRIPDHYITKLAGHHKQEVCGLRWNVETEQLASGGNDNKLFIWDKLNDQPTWRFSEHRAAVKAIAWNPHQKYLLASGGGTADKKIRFWNTQNGNLVKEIDTGSQVCNLMWSKNSNELVSTHGYSGGPISNQIQIWKYPSMTQIASLTGHTYRVLYLAMSPDGQTIVSGAGDETLRFWNVFQKAKGETNTYHNNGKGFGDGMGVISTIR
ncbi:uncharacterized protein L201_006864 [Kwoniella dendrophila CBS 6074]|uniref:CDC20/Fizzy WD40 domain-containing protein n=1 Tax=Kwoniella dendrophila CBS 6074 TaxID=1295534 RepID=A0AAX4K2Z3_9TREE